MKYILMICTCFAITLAAHSQKGLFLRVFDKTGKKTYKGFLSQLSDSSLTIKTGDTTTEVPLSKISTIKLKRSFGHTVGTSSLIGAGSFAILGVVTSDPDVFLGYSAAEGAAAGLVLGAGLGAAVGSIVAAAKTRTVLQINNDPKEWMKAKSALSYYLEK